MLLRDSFYPLTNERLLLLMRRRWVTGDRPQSSLFKESVSGVDVPGFQTKALIVPPVGGNNFGIIPSNCIVDLAGMLRQSRFSFTKKHCLLVLR